MEDAKINWNKINIEELKKVASRTLGIKEEDMVFVGVDFVFIEKHKKLRTTIGIYIRTTRKNNSNDKRKVD